MAVNLSPVGGAGAQFFTNNGTPLTGGKIYTYLAGTTTPAVTYTSSSGATPHANPIVLDSAGRVSGGGEIWLTNGVSYKFVLKTSTDVLIATYDNVTGINSVDASQVPYDPPFNGSVVTNVEAKLAQTVSVKDFGAVGNGVADDTAAFVAALAVSPAVFVPTGTYKITSVISMPANSALIGESREGSILTTTGVQILNISGVGTDNVTVRNLTLTSTGTTYGATVYVRNGAKQVDIINNIIISGFRPFMINDTADSYSAGYVRFNNNRTYSSSQDGGIRTRTALDNTVYPIWFINNIVIIDNATYEDVGIETWTGQTSVIDNFIYANNAKGDYSGIVFGVGENNIARGNRVHGFKMGIEIGGTVKGLHIVDGNVITACMQGIGVTTTGVEESIDIVNNMIVNNYAARTDYDYAFYIKSKAVNISGNTVYFHRAGTTYTSANSRLGYALYGDTNNKQLIVTNNTFKNLQIGIRAAATSPDVQVNNNVFYNVNNPISDSGGSPLTEFCNNLVNEFGTFLINKYCNFSNNVIRRSLDYTAGDAASLPVSPFVQSYTLNDPIIINSNNLFVNCLKTAWAVDTDYYSQGAGYARPYLEVINGNYKVANYSDPSQALLAVTNSSFNPIGKTIEEWNTGNYYYVGEGERVTTYISAAPATGTWKLGDIVWKTSPSSGTTPGWVCTTAGTPGTWSAMAALA